MHFMCCHCLHTYPKNTWWRVITNLKIAATNVISFLITFTGTELQNCELSYLQSFRTVKMSHLFQTFALFCQILILWNYAYYTINIWERGAGNLLLKTSANIKHSYRNYKQQTNSQFRQQSKIEQHDCTDSRPETGAFQITYSIGRGILSEYAVPCSPLFSFYIYTLREHLWQ